MAPGGATSSSRAQVVIGPPTRCSITPPKRSTSACTRATSAATLRSTSSGSSSVQVVTASSTSASRTVTSLRSAWCWAAPPVAAGSAIGRLWRFQKRSQRSNGSVVSRVTASPPGCARKCFGGALVERAAGSGWRAEWRGSAPDHLERAGCDAPDHLERADEPCHVADGGEHDQHRAERREHEGLPSCPPASARYPRGPGHRADPKVMIKITLYQIKSKSHSMREKFRRAPLMDVHADAGLRHTS